MSIYRPHTGANSIAAYGPNATMANNGGYPNSTLMSSFLSKMPFALQIVDALVKNNPKFYDFKNQASQRDDMLQDQSVFLSDNSSYGTYNSTQGAAGGSFSISKDYQAFVYAQIDKDKNRRLMDYRRMAAYAELADCLDEICDECVVINDKDEVVTLDIIGSYSKECQDILHKEWSTFIQIFDLENKGWELFRQLLVEGEIYIENLIHKEKKHLGIIGALSIPPDLINPVYHNVQNELLKGFLLRKPILGPTQSINSQDQEQLMFLQKAQVTYINSGLWNEFKTIRIPFIENAKRAYRQLTLIEDAVLIYRLVRAPERLVFKVNVGNMPPPRAEAYIKGLMMKFWSKKTYNGVEKQVSNVYDPQSMLDAYWFPVDAQGKGTDVSTLASTGSMSEVKDLDYFLTKLYKTLKVPVSRFLTAGDPFKDGNEITRDELRFARFIIRLQAQAAYGVKQSFITHLKLKGLWKEYKLREQALKIKFNEPTSFMTMRNQQILSLKFDNYNTSTQSDAIAKSFAQKYYLDWSAEQMKENREWLRRDAAMKWELEQIGSQGPNFRELLKAQQGSGGEIEGGGGFESGGGGGGGIQELMGGGSSLGAEEIPEFGATEAPLPAEAPAPVEGGGAEAAPAETTPSV